MCVCIYIYIYTLMKSLSLSLSIYIYIYVDRCLAMLRNVEPPTTPDHVFAPTTDHKDSAPAERVLSPTGT